MYKLYFSNAGGLLIVIATGLSRTWTQHRWWRALSFAGVVWTSLGSPSRCVNLLGNVGWRRSFGRFFFEHKSLKCRHSQALVAHCYFYFFMNHSRTICVYGVQFNRHVHKADSLCVVLWRTNSRKVAPCCGEARAFVAIRCKWRLFKLAPCFFEGKFTQVQSSCGGYLLNMDCNVGVQSPSFVVIRSRWVFWCVFCTRLVAYVFT